MLSDFITQLTELYEAAGDVDLYLGDIIEDNPPRFRLAAGTFLMNEGGPDGEASVCIFSACCVQHVHETVNRTNARWAQ